MVTKIKELDLSGNKFYDKDQLFAKGLKVSTQLNYLYLCISKFFISLLARCQIYSGRLELIALNLAHRDIAAGTYAKLYVFL